VVVLRERIITPESRREGHFRRPTLASPLASNVLVIKISGKLCETENLAVLAQQIKMLTEKGHKVILVHGGGKQIDQALAERGIVTQKKGGKRITPEEAIPAIADALGRINAQISDMLVRSGIPTVAIHANTEFSLVNARSLQGYERTGNVKKINTKIIEIVLQRSDVLVLSCLGQDEEGLVNINADEVATAVSKAVKAKTLILLSDVPGVLQDVKDETTLIPVITTATAAVLIDSGTAKNGMAVKVAECAAAARQGVEVLLADGSDVISLAGLMEGKGVHTRFIVAA